MYELRRPHGPVGPSSDSSMDILWSRVKKPRSLNRISLSSESSVSVPIPRPRSRLSYVKVETKVIDQLKVAT